jgi:hypothetical protein
MVENLDDKIEGKASERITLKPMELAEFASLSKVYLSAIPQINKLFEFYFREFTYTNVEDITNRIGSDIASLLNAPSFPDLLIKPYLAPR